jgi:hypothetical protein
VFSAPASVPEPASVHAELEPLTYKVFWLAAWAVSGVIEAAAMLRERMSPPSDSVVQLKEPACSETGHEALRHISTLS